MPAHEPDRALFGRCVSALLLRVAGFDVGPAAGEVVASEVGDRFRESARGEEAGERVRTRVIEPALREPDLNGVIFEGEEAQVECSGGGFGGYGRAVGDRREPRGVNVSGGVWPGSGLSDARFGARTLECLLARGSRVALCYGCLPVENGRQ
jgi:hypothetical protein